jgi:hypothetical protein
MNASKFLDSCEQVLHRNPHLSGDSLDLNQDHFKSWVMKRGVEVEGGKRGEGMRGVVLGEGRVGCEK